MRDSFVCIPLTRPLGHALVSAWQRQRLAADCSLLWRGEMFLPLHLWRVDYAHLYVHLEICLQTETDNLCKQPGAHIRTKQNARRTAGGCAVLICCDALWIISRYSVSLAAALAKNAFSTFQGDKAPLGLLKRDCFIGPATHLLLMKGNNFPCGTLASTDSSDALQKQRQKP